MAKILSRDEIRAAEDRPREVVNVPQWGGDVIVTGMSVAEQDKWFEALAQPAAGKGKGKGKPKPDELEISQENFRARLVVRCCVDEQGVRIFQDDDAEWLAEKSARALNAVWVVAAKLNGLDKEGN